MSQLEYVLNNLERNEESKNAVMVIYNMKEHSYLSKDNPCTMYLQYFIRDGYLHAITNMRSNDIWFGLSYDLPFFTIVQELLLVLYNERTGKDIKLGTYLHNAGSLHVYKKDYLKMIDCYTEYHANYADYKYSIEGEMPKIEKNDFDLYCMYENTNRNKNCIEDAELLQEIENKISDPLVIELLTYLKGEK